MATHSSILAWRIPRTDEPGGLQSWAQKELDTTEQLTLSMQIQMALKPSLPVAGAGALAESRLTTLITRFSWQHSDSHRPSGFFHCWSHPC